MIACDKCGKTSKDDYRLEIHTVAVVVGQVNLRRPDSKDSYTIGGNELCNECLKHLHMAMIGALMMWREGKIDKRGEEVEE